MSSEKSKLKIIGGKFRGKTFNFPVINSLRPTTNMIRETLFNWLMQDIHESSCLDLFAGSGSLGLEAYSRGAKEVIFIENNLEAYKNLCSTILYFKDSQLKVENHDAIKYLSNTHKKFDIIFLDPPFASSLLKQCLEIIYHNNILNPNGFIYCESNTNIDKNINKELDEKFIIYRHKKTGAVYYSLLRNKLS